MPMRPDAPDAITATLVHRMVLCTRSAAQVDDAPMPESRVPETPPATLKLRRIAIDTYRENVAYFRRDCCELYRAEGFQVLSNIEVSANGNRINAALNVVDDPSIVQSDELGLSEQASKQISPYPAVWCAWRTPNLPH
jgi:thymidine phosphorylase